MTAPTTLDGPRGPVQIIEMSFEDLKSWSAVQGLKSQKDKDLYLFTKEQEGTDAQSTYVADGTDERPILVF